MAETVSVPMFDTQRAVDELVAAGMPPEQAAARLAAVAAARCLPTATNQSQNSYTTSGDTT